MNCVAKCVSDGVGYLPCALFYRRIYLVLFLLEYAERCESGCHGNRIARQGSRLIYSAEWRHHAHDIAASAVCSHRHSASNYLAKCCEIRLYPKVFLGTAKAESETCDDLIKYKKCAVFICYVSEELKESIMRWNNSHICCNRLDHYCCNVFSLRLK